MNRAFGDCCNTAGAASNSTSKPFSGLSRPAARTTSDNGLSAGKNFEKVCFPDTGTVGNAFNRAALRITLKRELGTPALRTRSPCPADTATT